ncbi:hypothetical protein [Streptomyces sp. NPDC006140]|uniref:hypothetical protein n=1 Tax=Streptomyces sp. NPDC006140 TaxID=3154579 RepID=UPI003404CC32
MNTADEQNQIIEACRAHLSSQADRDDKAIEVLVLKRHSDSGLTVQQLPVPDKLWALYPPDTVLTALADAAVLLGTAATADTAAIALSYEGLAIAEDASPQADEAIRRHAAGGSIPLPSEIPGHIRQRFVSAIDRHCCHYLVSVDQPHEEGAAPAVGLAIADSEVSGRAAEALTTFAKAIWPHLAGGHGAAAAQDDL